MGWMRKEAQMNRMEEKKKRTYESSLTVDGRTAAKLVLQGYCCQATGRLEK